jgi:hypothetical protein
MGKASQAKKAARLARESGQPENRSARRLGFPLAVAAAVVIGVVVVVLARRPASQPKANLQLPAESTTVPADAASATTAPSADSVPTSVVVSSTTVSVAP